MADTQLTVAELMARAQKENPDSQPRRRRRRSLDEGGVSVAELTGSLKKVEARPAEVKHSSVPIDAEAEKPKTEKPAPKTEAPKPAPKAEKLAPKTEKVEQPKPAEKPAEKASTSVKVEPAKPASPAKPAQPKPQATSAKVEPKPAPKPTPAPTKRAADDQPKSAPKPELKKPQPKDEPTARGSFAAVAPQPSKTEQTGPITRVVTLDEKGEGGVDKRASIEEISDAAVTQESPVVRDEDLREEPTRVPDGQELVEEDNSVNPILLVLLVFAGLVVGVLMFLGFQYLWESFNPILVGVLAAAVTAGVVLLVRAMKTGRDALTMTLAAIAGAAMTFGPAAVTVL